MTGSVGLTSGSSMLRSSPVTMKDAQSSKQMISRNSGQRAATSRTVSSIGLPRNDETTNTPAARDCFSTYSTSLARKPGLTVTSTTPAIGAELHHHPFRQIVGPDGNPLARLEAAAQGACRALRLAVKLGIGPLAARRRVGDARNQRDPVRRRSRGLLQQLAERDVADGGNRGARDVRFLQSHLLSHQVFCRLDAVFRNLTGLWHPALVFCSRASKEIVVLGGTPW